MGDMGGKTEREPRRGTKRHKTFGLLTGGNGGNGARGFFCPLFSLLSSVVSGFRCKVGAQCVFLWDLPKTPGFWIEFIGDFPKATIFGRRRQDVEHGAWGTELGVKARCAQWERAVADKLRPVWLMADG